MRHYCASRHFVPADRPGPPSYLLPNKALILSLDKQYQLCIIFMSGVEDAKESNPMPDPLVPPRARVLRPNAPSPPRLFHLLPFRNVSRSLILLKVGPIGPITPLSPLESALTEYVSLSPLESALIKNTRGVGNYQKTRIHPPFVSRRLPLFLQGASYDSV